MTHCFDPTGPPQCRNGLAKVKFPSWEFTLCDVTKGADESSGFVETTPYTKGAPLTLWDQRVDGPFKHPAETAVSGCKQRAK